MVGSSNQTLPILPHISPNINGLCYSNIDEEDPFDR